HCAYPAFFLCTRSRHHRPLHSFPTRRSSDLVPRKWLDGYLSPGPCRTTRTGGSHRRRRRPRPFPMLAGLELFSACPKFWRDDSRSEEHTSELQSRFDLVCRLLLEKKKHNIRT